MGRKPLSDKYVEQLVVIAKTFGTDGITRKEVLKAGVLSEDRWALIKNKAVKQGRIIRVGWKKSARYFAPGFEPQETEEEIRIGHDEEDDMENIFEMLDDFQNIAEENTDEKETTTQNTTKVDKETKSMDDDWYNSTDDDEWDFTFGEEE